MSPSEPAVVVMGEEMLIVCIIIINMEGVFITFLHLLFLLARPVPSVHIKCRAEFPDCNKPKEERVSHF